jgi:molybdopterin/thiamine biosynthesis adenylyltransferase
VVNSHPPDAFSRQIVLPELGLSGQRRLAHARALVVGCGGLGAPAAISLAAAGVGHVTVVDDDVVEGSNLNRQTWFCPEDLGRDKAATAAAYLARHFPGVTVEARRERVVAGAVRAAVRNVDVVLDCSDGMPTKFMLNDACVREDRALVHGAATALAGQVLVVPGARGPCLRCLFEDVPPRGAMPTCRTAGILGAVTGIVGHWMALEAIKVIAHIPGTLAGRFLALDLSTSSSRTMSFTRRADCAACGDAPTADALRSSDYERDDVECD